MSDDADNLVLPHLRELRTHLDERFDKVDARFDEADVRLVKVEARLESVEALARKTMTEVVGVARRAEHIENGLRVADRLTAIEERLAELERRRS